MTENAKLKTLEPAFPGYTATFLGVPKSSNGRCRYVHNPVLSEVTIHINLKSDFNGTLFLGNIGELHTPAYDILMIIPQWNGAVTPKNLQINRNGDVFILEAESGAHYKTQVRVQI